MKKLVLFFCIMFAFLAFSTEMKAIQPERIIDLGEISSTKPFQISVNCSTEKVVGWAAAINKVSANVCGNVFFDLGGIEGFVSPGSSFYFEIYLYNTLTSKGDAIGITGIYKE